MSLLEKQINMLKDTLLNEIAEKRIEEIMHAKGYAYFKTGDYNLNIIGIRSNQNNKVTNKFDDFMLVTYYIKGVLHSKVYNITTDPGRYYMQNLCNKKGTAILVPGQYRGCWKVGTHNGKYTALVQSKPVKVYRDANKNDIYDYLNIDEGIFGINIHRSNPYSTSTNIDNWSAGCQVFANAKDFTEFMKLCEEQKKRYGNSFTYTLLNEKDLI